MDPIDPTNSELSEDDKELVASLKDAFNDQLESHGILPRPLLCANPREILHRIRTNHKNLWAFLRVPAIYGLMIFLAWKLGKWNLM